MPATTPPTSPVTTPALTPPPAPPTAAQTIDGSQNNVAPNIKSLQRLEYELNADLHRGIVVMPLDLNISAWLIAKIPNAGPEFTGNWIIESHVIDLSSSEHAISDVEMRKCQNIAAL
jgi:hypothetical protein